MSTVSLRTFAIAGACLSLVTGSACQPPSGEEADTATGNVQGGADSSSVCCDEVALEKGIAGSPFAPFIRAPLVPEDDIKELRARTTAAWEVVVKDQKLEYTDVRSEAATVAHCQPARYSVNLAIGVRFDSKKTTLTPERVLDALYGDWTVFWKHGISTKPVALDEVGKDELGNVRQGQAFVFNPVSTLSQGVKLSVRVHPPLFGQTDPLIDYPGTTIALDPVVGKRKWKYLVPVDLGGSPGDAFEVKMHLLVTSEGGQTVLREVWREGKIGPGAANAPSLGGKLHVMAQLSSFPRQLLPECGGRGHTGWTGLAQFLEGNAPNCP